MCMLCRSYPCDPRCPNAPEPKAVYHCSHCNEAIVDGDGYIEFMGNYYHEDCFNEAAKEILMEDYDAKMHEGEVSDNPHVIGTCALCAGKQHDEIMSDCEHYYTMDGKMYHDECFELYADELLKKQLSWKIRTFIAEAD